MFFMTKKAAQVAAEQAAARGMLGGAMIAVIGLIPLITFLFYNRKVVQTRLREARERLSEVEMDLREYKQNWGSEPVLTDRLATLLAEEKERKRLQKVREEIRCNLVSVCKSLS